MPVRVRHILMAAGLGLVVLWLTLAAHRWGCSPWLSKRCVSGAAETFEAAFLLLWVDDREALLAGVLAVTAAAAGVIYVQKQIKQAEAHERRRLRRRYRAQKAAMPLTLSSLCDYAKESAWKLSQCRDLLRRQQHPSLEALGEFEPPKLSVEVVTALQRMVEASSKSRAKPFIALLSDLQVHTARWRGLMESLVGDRPGVGYAVGYFDSEIVEAAELYARASDLFAVTRPDPEPDIAAPTTLSSALRLMGFRGTGYASINELAAQRDARRAAAPARLPDEITGN